MMECFWLVSKVALSGFRRNHSMKPQYIIPRVGKTLISIGFGLVLVCGVLLLFGNVTQLASAAPLPPRDIPAPPLQAVVTVTTTIQDAINAALPGDTVVFSGTYTEKSDWLKILPWRVDA
jgi:hypothetical protein